MTEYTLELSLKSGYCIVMLNKLHEYEGLFGSTKGRGRILKPPYYPYNTDLIRNKSVFII